MTESNDKQLPDEQQLDEYLKGDSSVSRQYRQLRDVEVPAQLDRLVLRQAEDALQSRPSRGRPAWVRWTAPLAVAASAVLVFSIVIETGVRDDTVTHVSGPQVPRPTMQAKQRERTQNETEDAIVTEQAAASEPASVPAEPPSSAIVLEMPAPEKSTRLEAPAMAPQAPAPSLPFSSPPAAAPAPDVAAAGQSVARSADIAKRELQSRAASDVAQKQSAAVADDAAREEERSAAVAYSRRVSAPIPAPPEEYTDPEEWLKAIRQLREANEQEQADREWRRFRVAFPTYEVAEADSAREVKK